MINAVALSPMPALRIPGWLPAAVLIAITALAGPSLGGGARPFFLLGSLIAGWYAWSRSPGAHLQAVIALFVFAPFLRRVVDLSAGFDPGGVLLAGPLLALLPPLQDLRALTVPGQETNRGLDLFLPFSACVLYCIAVTLAQGEWSQAASGTLKWGAPLLYGIVIYQRPELRNELVQDATTAFALILPVIGLYGIYQHVNPPLWDRYWLVNAAITSAGSPEPFQVRTFSSMHAPASFATFTVSGLLLIYIFRSAWFTRLAMLPAVLALALSLYRTAWMSLAAAVLFCLFFRATRARTIVALLILAGAIIMALLLTPFGDVVAGRLSTFGDASNDGSGQERLQEFYTLWEQPLGGLFGTGFAGGDIRTAGTAAIDGMIATCWVSMGIVLGLVYLACLIRLIFLGMAPALKSGGKEAIALGALACGWLVQLPLAGIVSGEVGFLFWTFAALAMVESGESANT
jgi:O-antigen ligase